MQLLQMRECMKLIDIFIFCCAIPDLMQLLQMLKCMHLTVIFITFYSRLDAIAADAELQEKSVAELTKLADLLHDGCERAIKEYQEKLVQDANFDGKKRGASFKISGVSVNAASVLKHEEELEPLAVCIPQNPEERKQ